VRETRPTILHIDGVVGRAALIRRSAPPSPDGEGLIIRTVLVFDRPYNLQSRISIQVQEFVVGPWLAIVFDTGTIVTRVGQREASRHPRVVLSFNELTSTISLDFDLPTSR
jgi:hypothetical protein